MIIVLPVKPFDKSESTLSAVENYASISSIIFTTQCNVLAVYYDCYCLTTLL